MERRESGPLVSVIIPNWNGAILLPLCLASLQKQTYPRFETIVVDDASTDNSLELLAKDHPGVLVISHTTNRGFAAAVNTGIRAATSGEGHATADILVLLNNDTEAEPDWLSELVSALENNPQAAMAASKLRLFDRRDKLHSAGDFYRVDGVPGNRGVWEVDRGQYDALDAKPPLFGACAGAAAYRRDLFDAIGLFDEDLAFACEDVDMNWRARLAGFECVYAPRAIVYHMLSATGGGPHGSYYVGRNFILVLAKDFPTRLWRRHWAKIVQAQLSITLDAIGHWRGAAARARLRGQLAGLASLPGFMSKRAQVQKTKRVSDDELELILAK